MFNSEQITKKVAIYIRVSTEEQVERYGIDLQKDSLFNLIKSRPKLDGGLDSMILAGEGDQYIYVDEGISGTTELDERPAFAKLKEDIIGAPEGEKPFDVVLVYKIDRFARRLKILLDVIEFFEDNNIKFISANESIDTSTPFGRAMLGIIGVIAELEIETIKMRTEDGRKQAFEKGVVLGANSPYGYIKDVDKKYKVLEKEAKIVKDIFDMFVDEGLTFNQIAKELNFRNIPSPEVSSINNGKRSGDIKKKSKQNFWFANRIGLILRDEIYIGKIWGGKRKNGKNIPRSEWELSKSQAPSIIDLITFEKARKRLNSVKNIKRTAKDGHIYLLSGLLKCDCCHNNSNSEERITWCGNRKKVGSGYQYYYRCSRKEKSKSPFSCNSLPINANEIEKYIVDYSRKLLKNPIATFNYQLKKQSQENILKQLNKKEQEFVNLLNKIPIRKQRLQEQHTEGIIDISTLKQKTNELESVRKRYEEKIAEIRKELSENNLSKNYIDVLDLFTEKYKPMLKDSFKDKKALYMILHQLIEEIVVYTRPVKTSDSIAGKKKEGQEIPNRIHIKLRLPQEIFGQIVKTSSTQKSPSGARERTRTSTDCSTGS